MAVLLLTRPQGGSQISCRRGGPIARLGTRMQAWRLDIALARGADPDSATSLSLRAHDLIGHGTRLMLAGEIERLLRDARRPVSLPRLSLAPCRRQLLAAEPLFRTLVQRLLDAGPVEAAGVARVRLLLRDGAGPIYNRARAGELERLALAALVALEPRLPEDGDADWPRSHAGSA